MGRKVIKMIMEKFLSFLGFFGRFVFRIIIFGFIKVLGEYGC